MVKIRVGRMRVANQRRKLRRTLGLSTMFPGRGTMRGSRGRLQARGWGPARQWRVPVELL